ncbi:MAG: HEAT repeat domain-containing protein [Sandaracinaceae bacterium]|nr:HEAT repeat domain-containing protein [Sandaracinaceae bacterium]
MRRVTLVCTVLALALGLSATADAQQARRTPGRRRAQPTEAVEGGGPAPSLEDLPTIAARLHSANADEVRESITLLTILNEEAAVPHLADLLRSGQNDSITDAALEALQRLAMPSSIDVLTEFTHHRRVGARRRAYAGIAAIRNDRRVPTLLEQGLRDSDRGIREESAEALGRMGARGSLEMLFRAFERGVLGAGEAIGRLGNDADVARFNAFLGRMPISVMLGGYDQFLQRRDISDAVKLDIVNRLRDVSGRMVCQSLLTYRDTLPPLGRQAPSELRRALTQALDQIAWDGGSTRCRSLDRAPAAAAEGGAR